MQRAQIYLSEPQRHSLSAVARQRGTTQSALVRQAVDEFLVRQPALDPVAARLKVFGAWAANAQAPSLRELRSEERQFGR
jgi:hypothetical protein